MTIDDELGEKMLKLLGTEPPSMPGRTTNFGARLAKMDVMKHFADCEREYHLPPKLSKPVIFRRWLPG